MKQYISKRFIKWVACLLAVMLISAGASAELLLTGRSCDDEVCPIPTVNEDNQPLYAIVSPVGYHAVDMIAQAPRLDTLDGKRIALVGGSFMASVTHDQLRLCI